MPPLPPQADERKNAARKSARDGFMFASALRRLPPCGRRRGIVEEGAGVGPRRQ